MTSIAELSEAQKAELAVSLAALLCEDGEVEITADNLNSVLKASGNTIPAYWTTLFASMLEKSEGCAKFLGGPGSGGGGGGGAAAGGAAPAAEEKKEEEEEEEIDMGGGMDMFGGDGGDY